tara:strand:+ start:41 stop:214 length:174 start_codon:yes stop_codon:yes gene_type:complete
MNIKTKRKCKPIRPLKDLIYKVKLRRHLKIMDSGLNDMEEHWYDIYENKLIKLNGGQ